MENFTGIESIIDWMEETGLLDAITEMITDITVQSIYAVLALLFSAISSLAIGGVILTVIAIAVVVTVLIMILLYVLRGIGLSRIAKKLGVKNRFLAWIPYGNAYLMGVCAEQSMKRNGKKTWKWGLILLFTTLAMGIGQPIIQFLLTNLLSIVPGLSVIVNLILELSSIILLAMVAHCLWSIFKEYVDSIPAVIMAILGALGGDLTAVLLFIFGCLKLRPTTTPEEPTPALEEANLQPQ